MTEPATTATATAIAGTGIMVAGIATAQAMPWIDPVKEASAWQILVQSGFASEVEAIRRRGGNPAGVLEQIADFRKRAAEMGLKFSTMVDDEAPPGADEADDEEGA